MPCGTPFSLMAGERTPGAASPWTFLTGAPRHVFQCPSPWSVSLILLENGPRAQLVFASWQVYFYKNDLRIISPVVYFCLKFFRIFVLIVQV